MVSAPMQQGTMVRKETCHEDLYRCSRLGDADCHPDVRACECGAGVPGELLIRLERLLIDKLRSALRSGRPCAGRFAIAAHSSRPALCRASTSSFLGSPKTWMAPELGLARVPH